MFSASPDFDFQVPRQADRATRDVHTCASRVGVIPVMDERDLIAAIWAVLRTETTSSIPSSYDGGANLFSTLLPQKFVPPMYDLNGKCTTREG